MSAADTPSIRYRLAALGALTVAGLGAYFRPGRSAAESPICVKDLRAPGDPCDDDTAVIQRAINRHRTLSAEERRRSPIVLDGVHIVSQLIVTQANNGLTITGGTLVRKAGTGPGPNALLTIKQEANSPVPLDGITVTDMIFTAAARYTPTQIDDDGDTAANLRNYQYCNGVEFFSEQRNPAQRGVRNCRVERVSGKGLGKSAVIFDEPESCLVRDVRAERCVGHAVAVSATSDHRKWPAARKLSIDIDGVSGIDTMTLLDLSAITDYANADRFRAEAQVRNLTGKRIRGRSKIAGVWAVNLDGVNVDNTGVAFRKWGAINLVARDYTSMNVSNVVARNMRAAVLGDVYSQLATIHLKNITAIDCNEGVNSVARTVLVTGLNTDNTYVPIAVSSANETVVVDGFSFKRVSRQSYVPTSGWPEYGIQSLPKKAFTLKDGTFDGIGNASLSYDDFFIYAPPESPRTQVYIKNVRIAGSMPRAFRHFLRNDSPNVTIKFEDFDVASGMFRDYVVTNPGKGLLTMVRATIRGRLTVSDLFDGTLARVGQQFAWADGDWIYVSGTRPRHRQDGAIVGVAS